MVPLISRARQPIARQRIARQRIARQP